MSEATEAADATEAAGSTETARERLIEALAQQVPFEGWGEKALVAAAEAEGLNPVVASDLLPTGKRQQVMAFSAWADRRMAEALKALPSGQELERLKVRERVALALRTRFEILYPHRDAVRRGLQIFALPGNAAAGLTAVHRTADAVWNAVGDPSTDWNWYSKRFLLSGVISTTTLYWLDDKSEDHEKTWSFLDRQLETVVKIGGRVGQSAKRLLSLPDRLLARGIKAGRKTYGV